MVLQGAVHPPSIRSPRRPVRRKVEGSQRNQLVGRMAHWAFEEEEEEEERPVARTKRSGHLVVSGEMCRRALPVLSLLQRTSVSVLGSRDPGWLLDQAKIFAKIEWKDTSKNSQEV